MMDNTVHNLVVKGAILAGGRACRMGGLPKGTLRGDGTLSLVERLLMQAARSGIREMVLVGNETRAYAHLPCEIIPDTQINMGPVVGIEAALNYFNMGCDAVLFLPCDLPEISSKEISTLVDAFAGSNAPVVFAETVDGREHPLCAVVSTSLRADVSTAISTGMLCASNLWARLGGLGVVSDNTEAFTNLNSFTDVNAWRARKRTRVVQAPAARSYRTIESAVCSDPPGQCRSMR